MGPLWVASIIARLADFMKMNGVTMLMTALVEQDAIATAVNVSSLVDVWLTLSNTVNDGARVRTLTVIKTRGMEHSTQTHELVISRNGIEIKHPVVSRNQS